MAPTTPRSRLSVYRYRRALTIVSILAVLLAAVVTVNGDRHGTTVTALPGATAQPAPTGPTGGPGGGPGGPAFPLQPPDMPSAPGGYNSGSYPAPDQNNGISIYNSDAPQSADADSQAANFPQSRQPANGTQPPDYDHPISPQPSAQQQQGNQPQRQQPQASQQGTPTQQPTQSATPRQQPSQSQQSSPTQTSSPNRENQQQKDRDCQGISGLSSVADGKVIYTAPTQIADQVSAAAQQWNNLAGIQFVAGEQTTTPQATVAGGDDQVPPGESHSGDGDNDSQRLSGDTGSGVTLEITVISDPSVAWGGEYIGSSEPGKAHIVINLARVDQAGPDGLRSVLGHELGHAAGLDDFEQRGQLMSGSGQLPTEPQASDIERFNQLSANPVLSQQCAAQGLGDALKAEYWCPGSWMQSTCDFVGGVGSETWNDITDIWSLISELGKAAAGDGVSQTALRQAFGPLLGLGPDGSPGVGSAWKNLGIGALNDLIGLDKWQAGQYQEAMERIVANIVEIAATVGAGTVAKLIKGLAKALRDAKDAAKAAEDAAQAAKQAADDAAKQAAKETDEAIQAAKQCANSFTGDTLVTLADGTRRAISLIRVGDSVLAADPATGRTGPQRVTDTISHSGVHEMVTLSFDSGSSVTATRGHPFWNPGQKAFVKAGDVKPGDRVQTETGGTATVVRTAEFKLDIDAYNLEVDTVHTYFAGVPGILVHNSCDLTGPQQTDLAKWLGFRKTNLTSHGQAIFQKGKDFISADVGSGNGLGSHNGGVWKMAKSPEALASKATRTGTFNYDLSVRVGD